MDTRSSETGTPDPGSRYGKTVKREEKAGLARL